MLAVQKVMLESLLNFRIRGATLTYEELLTALENIVIDKVSAAPTSRGKKVVDTSALIEIGMAAKDDSESSREERDHRNVDVALQAFDKRTRIRQLEVPERVNLEHSQVHKWQRWKGSRSRRKAFMTDRQLHQRRHVNSERWQRRQQDMLGWSQSRTHCSLVSKRRQQDPACHV